jgi:C1A family cysteine protease
MIKKSWSLFILLLYFTGLMAQIENYVMPVNPDFQNFIDSFSTDSSALENYNGYVPPFFKLPEFYSKDIEDETSYNLKSAIVTLPATYDLRTLDGITSVKNQGGGTYGGNCWAFACIGTIESNWLVGGYGNFDLSEKNLAACHGFAWQYGQGGNESFAMAYLTRLSGPVADSLDPYAGRKTSCVDTLPVVAYVPEVRWLYNNRTLTKRAIMDYGGATTNIYMENKYLESTSYTYYYGGPKVPNHAIMLLGWDDTKVTRGGKGAWIAKNSYGETWGENGFFYISYAEKSVLKPVIYYPVRWSLGTINKIYNYAELGALSFYGNSTETATAVIKYYAPTQRYIRKVGTFLGRTGATVDIDIYSYKIGKNLYNLLKHYTSDPVRSVGYYTFDMPTIVDGDFYIKVTYHTPGLTSPVPIEMAIKDKDDTSKYMANPIIEPSGKQWLILQDGSWQPLGSDINGWNVDLAINAYANYSLAPKASFKMSKFEVCANSTIIFTDESDGEITDYTWNFGADASPSTATGKGPHTVTFNSGAVIGLRHPKLIVSGPTGKDSIFKEYKVSNKPVIQIAYPEIVRTNDTVLLTAIGDADSFTWYPVTNLNGSTGNKVYFSDSVAGFYRYKVTGTQGDCISTGIIELSLKTRPVNDNMCDAIELHMGDNGPFTNTYASVQYNEPLPDETNCNASMQWCSEQGLQNSVWFKFTGPSSGYASFDTRGFDTQIAIYNSTSCENIKKADLIAANDDYHPEKPNPAALNLAPLTPGQIYWIQIDGSSGGDSGVFYITIAESPLGVKKFNFGMSELKIIPNPNKGNATLNYSSSFNEAISVKIYDLTGKIILQKQIDKINGEINYKLDLNNVPKGMYYINLSSDKTFQTTKFVIQ